MTVVVVTPRGKVAEAIAKQLLPNPIAIVTAQCCYHFFNVIDGGVEPFAFRDLDGEMLAEYRTFPTLEAAKAWVGEDAGRRHAKAGRPQ
jgi:hypothetical protein